MRLFFSALIFLTAVALNAQIIKAIHYKGLFHMSKSVAASLIDIKPGEVLNIKQIDNSIKTYFQQGYFDDIWVTDKDGVITFHFKEKPIISKVIVKGYKADDKTFLQDTIKIKRGTLYDQKKIDAAKKRIVEYLNKKGKIDTVVVVRKKLEKNGSMHLTFLIDEGHEIIIKKITYSGLKNFDPSRFNDVVANKQHQWMGWFWGRNSGELKLNQLKYDPLRMRDLFMQYGYLDAKVDMPFTRVDFNNYTAYMSYHIDEGVQYKVSQIHVYETKNVVNPASLKKVIEMKVGKYFNIKTFRADSKRIKTIIANKGYAFVQVVPDLQEDKKNHTVNLTYKVIPGDKVYIHNVIISGNTSTLDRVIRRVLYLGPGDLFSLTDLKDSKNALGRLGFFSSSTIQEHRLSAHSMDLVVMVKEQPTGNIQIGGGYGSYGGILLSVAVNDRDIFGSGITVGVQLNKSQMTHNYSFSISNPHLDDSDYSGNFAVYQSGTNYTNYNVQSNGLSLGMGHQFTRHINGYLGYSYSSNSYSNINIITSPLSQYYFTSYNKSAVTLSVIFNNTNNYYLPTTGFIASESIEKAGLGANANFIKTQTAYNKYYGLKHLTGKNIIFRYKAKFNYALNTGYLPVAERYYMGGIGSVLGYQAYSLSPTIISNGTKVNIGGEQRFTNSVELSFPLINKAKMRLVTFVNWGFIGDSSLTQISRGGYGAGIEWFSPVGPIQLMFANPLNEHAGDNVSHFAFTLGQKF